MHRLLAILLMLVVPLQFGWNTALSIHGHSHGDGAVLGFHTHDSTGTGHGDNHHSHRGEAPSGQAGSDGDKPLQHPPSGTGSAGNDGDGVDGHYHPVFASLVMYIAELRAATSSGGPPSRPPDSFTSRIPPLFDWPPSART